MVRHELPLRRPGDRADSRDADAAAVARANRRAGYHVDRDRPVQPGEAQQARARPRRCPGRAGRRRRGVGLGPPPPRPAPAARRAVPGHGARRFRCRPSRRRLCRCRRPRPRRSADRHGPVRPRLSRDRRGAGPHRPCRPGAGRPGRGHAIDARVGCAAGARRGGHGRPQRVARRHRPRARRPRRCRRRQADPPRAVDQPDVPALHRRGRGPARRVPVRPREGKRAGPLAGCRSRRHDAGRPAAAAGRVARGRRAGRARATGRATRCPVGPRPAALPDHHHRIAAADQ